MDSSLTRRRRIDPPVQIHKIYEQLYLSAQLRMSTPFTGDPLGFALRIAMLADLSLEGAICLRSGHVSVCDNVVDDFILSEMQNKLRMRGASPEEWVRIFNGESFTFSSLKIKKLRQRIGKVMEEAKMIRIERKGMFRSNIILDNTIRINIINDIMEYLKDDRHSLALDVLLVCMTFVQGILTIILSTVTPQQARTAQAKIERIKRRFNEDIPGKGEEIIFILMRWILK
ncbi:hypothetical protein TCON_1114 [Astathelohania contejeani]|uniref:Uncharacterized protein n=1 Tax=Astathelohania contejeani TaxID=164912 RepID=A0ABQ7HZR0_9MICR|nr:hypothetical protein TCON_1114 [Thelohania contejeani]